MQCARRCYETVLSFSPFIYRGFKSALACLRSHSDGRRPGDAPRQPDSGAHRKQMFDLYTAQRALPRGKYHAPWHRGLLHTKTLSAHSEGAASQRGANLTQIFRVKPEALTEGVISKPQQITSNLYTFFVYASSSFLSFFFVNSSALK